MPSPPPDWIRPKAASTLDPGRAAGALDRLAEAWPGDLPPLRDLVEGFPLGEEALLHLLAYSPVSVEKLLRDPAALSWLCEPGICDADRALWQMRVDLARARGNEAPFDEGFVALRRQKARELMRIALREISRAAPLEQTALEISLLAELCIGEVHGGWHRHLSGRWGAPGSAFCVLGMGKLGGGELNYSSDIDLIYLYSDDGQLNPNFTYQQFFTRLAEKITSTFSAPHDAGPLFRIDLRLRPDGSSGPILRSLEGMEHYYAAYGETWERMALVKARPVAGDPALGYEFLQRLQPFVYPRHLTVDTLGEIAALKRRIDRELVAPSNRGREIKRGRGGIREIEFIVQSLQIMHGARHPFLQQPGTLKALEALRALDDPALIESAEAESLADAYRTLRTLEHRIMIAGEKQTHLVPADPGELRRLSASLGFPSRAAFLEDLAATTGRVQALFDAHFQDLPEPPREEFDLSFFRSPAEAAAQIARLAGESGGAALSPRARRVFRALKPSFLRSLAYAAEPDLVLNRFSRFIESYGIRATLYEVLIQHPRLLELLTKLFDASSFVSETAIRRPELVEEIARAGGIDERREVDDYLRELAAESVRPDLDPGDLLRRFRAAATLRIALRDVLGLASIDDVLLEYTALAEACLRHYLEQSGAIASLSVVAMGKFGARELCYGSDLDVVFIGNEVAPAAKLLAEFSRVTAEGRLDEIDARLRPEGRSGVLVCPLAAYERYFENRAGLWEAQALTKARPVCGPQSAEVQSAIRAIWSRFGRQPDLFKAVASMLERIHKERAGAEDLLDFKTGRGGTIAIEFAVQAHQMRADLWEPSTLAAAAKLCEAGYIPAAAAADLREAYGLLRRCAFVLRRLENRGVTRIPADPDAQKALARRLGFPDAPAFLAAYGDARRRAAEVVKDLLGT